jgi:peroxiredoxin
MWRLRCAAKRCCATQPAAANPFSLRCRGYGRPRTGGYARTLTAHDKTRPRLSELQGNDPMILLLSRGHYGPPDNQQHLELVSFYSKIAVAYTQIVTISTDSIVETNEFRDSVGAQWAFLLDAGRKVQNDLDVREYTDPRHDPVIPHTFVLKPGLVVYSIYNGCWFWDGPQSKICAATYARSRARFDRTWAWRHQGCARRGTPATARSSTRTTARSPGKAMPARTPGSDQWLPGRD